MAFRHRTDAYARDCDDTPDRGDLARRTRPASKVERNRAICQRYRLYL